MVSRSGAGGGTRHGVARARRGQSAAGRLRLSQGHRGRCRAPGGRWQGDRVPVLAEQAGAVRERPAPRCSRAARRATRRSFLQVMSRAMSRALYTGDHDGLGELMTTSKAGLQFAAGKTETTRRYLTVLYEHGLLSDDPAADPVLSYRLSGTVTGFFLLEGIPGAADFDLEDKADALATTLRRAFEPTTEPTLAMLRAAAGDLTDLYQQWMADLTDSLPVSTKAKEDPAWCR